MKKTIAIILAAIMLLSFSAFTGFAEENEKISQKLIDKLATADENDIVTVTVFLAQYDRDIDIAEPELPVKPDGNGDRSIQVVQDAIAEQRAKNRAAITASNKKALEEINVDYTLVYMAHYIPMADIEVCVKDIPSLAMSPSVTYVTYMNDLTPVPTTVDNNAVKYYKLEVDGKTVSFADNEYYKIFEEYYSSLEDGKTDSIYDKLHTPMYITEEYKPTMAQARALLRYAMKLDNAPAERQNAKKFLFMGDADLDGKITVRDARTAMRVAVGLEKGKTYTYDVGFWTY